MSRSTFIQNDNEIQKSRNDNDNHWKPSSNHHLDAFPAKWFPTPRTKTPLSRATYPLLIFQSMGNQLSLLLAGLRNRFHFPGIKFLLSFSEASKCPEKEDHAHHRCGSHQPNGTTLPLHKCSQLLNFRWGASLAIAALALGAAAAGILTPGTWGFTLVPRVASWEPRGPI